MNETYDEIVGLRAIRQYRQEPLRKDDLDAILEAARWTGSSKNRQDWAFIVVDDAHVLFDTAPDRYAARMTRADRPRARELMAFFNEVWEHGDRPPDLRELRL